MKRKLLKIFIILLVLLVLCYILYQLIGWNVATRRYQAHVKSLLDKQSNEIFTPGEKIAYTLRYMGLPAGKAITRVQEITEFNNREVYVLTGRVRTSDFISLFFEAEGRVCSYIDSKRFHSLYFHGESQASGHRKNEKTLIFNQQDLFLQIDGGEKVRILPDTQDPLSAFYFLRLLDYDKIKEGYEINIKSRKRDRTLVVKTQGKEKIKTPFGEIETIKVYIHLKPVKATSRHEISGFVWLTDDKKKIPIRVRLKTKAGPASFLLYDLDL